MFRAGSLPVPRKQRIRSFRKTLWLENSTSPALFRSGVRFGRTPRQDGSGVCPRLVLCTPPPRTANPENTSSRQRILRFRLSACRRRMPESRHIPVSSPGLAAANGLSATGTSPDCISPIGHGSPAVPLCRRHGGIQSSFSSLCRTYENTSAVRLFSHLSYRKNNKYLRLFQEKGKYGVSFHCR